jgi:aspartate carbamoyltransferase catalytic subunit
MCLSSMLFPDADDVSKVGEHPTQALLDVFTIWDELGLSLDIEHGDSKNETKHAGQLVVVMLGDLKHGRTVHSLAKLLARSSIKHELVLRYCTPKTLEMPSHVKEYVDQFPNAKQEEYSDIQEAVQGANVLYVTRVQKERFEDVKQYDEVKVSELNKMKNALSWILKPDGL